MATRMQQRRGTAEQWTLADPVLAAGEIGLETDTNKFKIGDGVNNWADLSYFVNSDGLSGELEGFATEEYVDTAIENVVGLAPETLDTLAELADALGDDPAAITTLQSDVSALQTGKADLVDGQVPANQLANATVDLSDYATEEASKQNTADIIQKAFTAYVATASVLPSNTFSTNLGITTITSTANESLVIDGMGVVSGVRILVKNMSSYNGLYEVVSAGSSGGKDDPAPWVIQTYTGQLVGNGTEPISGNMGIVRVLFGIQNGNKVFVSTASGSGIEYSEISTKDYVDDAIANVVGLAPETLDTLSELADALGDNPAAITTLQSDVSSLQSDKADTNSPTFTGLTDFEGIVDFSEAVVIGIDALPDQDGNSGKYLTTDGQVASWQTVASPTPHPFSMIG